jgi:hypothetical protein
MRVLSRLALTAVAVLAVSALAFAGTGAIVGAGATRRVTAMDDAAVRASPGAHTPAPSLWY